MGIASKMQIAGVRDTCEMRIAGVQDTGEMPNAVVWDTGESGIAGVRTPAKQFQTVFSQTKAIALAFKTALFKKS